MKQEISVLMDGELFEDEAEVFLDRIKRDSSIQKDWEIYHLVGDVLRQPEHIHGGLSARVHRLMQNEPTILAPRGGTVRQKARTLALSAAASLLAVGVVVWMSLQISPETPPQLAMQQGVNRPVSAQIKPDSNDYLMAHQEFSPNTDMNGGTSYAHTVSYSSDKKPPK